MKTTLPAPIGRNRAQQARHGENPKRSIIVEFEEVEHSLNCGLRVEWCSGTRGQGKRKETVSVTTGAGVGSPWLIYTRSKADGRELCLVLHIGKLVAALNKLQPTEKP